MKGLPYGGGLFVCFDNTSTIFVVLIIVMADQGVSINKYISSSGLCSRREADQWILEDRVLLNGKVPEPGNRVYDGDVVKVDGRVIKAKAGVRQIYIALNKPEGIVCTTDPKEPMNIISFMKYPKRLFPIGRLDKDSQGLIFLTNDGDIVNKILRAGNKHQKEYVVSVNKPITTEFIDKMRNGVRILDTYTKKCEVVQVNKTTFNIILTQGMNRQIRRMCEALGYRVTKLIRTRIMSVELAKLPVGHWRELDAKEVDLLNNLVAGSSKTEEASRDRKKKPFSAKNKPKAAPPKATKKPDKKKTTFKQNRAKKR